MSTGLAILAGILGGAGGLGKGMAEGTAADQRQQQIDESVRARQVQEQNATTDVGQLFGMLGLQPPPGMTPGQRLPNQVASMGAQKMLADQTKATERAETESAIAQIPEQWRPYARIKGGADFAKLAYPNATPKPSAPHYVEGVGGDISAVTIQNGEPTVIPVPGIKGKGMESRALTTRADIERQLRNEGLQPGTPKWDRRYLEYSQPTTPVPDVGIYSKPDALGSPQSAASVPSGTPNGNALRAQAAQTTTPNLKAALLEAATAADRAGAAGGAGGSPPPGAPAPRTAGAPGGPQPSLAFPKKPLSPDDAGALGVPYGTTKEGAYGATPLTAGQRTKMDAQASVLAMIDNMEADLKGFSLPKGPVDRITGIPNAVLGVKGQTNPKLSAFHSRIESTLALVVRALGEVGTLTDGDIQRARNLQPTVYPVPDTADVVKEKMQGLRKLVQEVAARTGSRPENMGQPGPQPGAAPSGGKVRWERDASGKPVRVP